MFLSKHWGLTVRPWTSGREEECRAFLLCTSPPLNLKLKKCLDWFFKSNVFTLLQYCCTTLLYIFFSCRFTERLVKVGLLYGPKHVVTGVAHSLFVCSCFPAWPAACLWPTSLPDCKPFIKNTDLVLFLQPVQPVCQYSNIGVPFHPEGVGESHFKIRKRPFNKLFAQSWNDTFV